MRADLLHVVTAVANPMRWQSRIRLYRDFAARMLDSGVRLTVVECAFGERPHERVFPAAGADHQDGAGEGGTQRTCSFLR